MDPKLVDIETYSRLEQVRIDHAQIGGNGWNLAMSSPVIVRKCERFTGLPDAKPVARQQGSSELALGR